VAGKCVASAEDVTCPIASDCTVACSNGDTGTIAGAADGSFVVNLKANGQVVCPPSTGSTSSSGAPSIPDAGHD
jgi:hypothetical protein